MNRKNEKNKNSKMAYDSLNLAHSLKGQVIKQASLCSYQSKI